MELSRCRNCRSLSLKDITDEGYILYPNVRELRTAAGDGDEELCDLCSLVWGSLRYDIHKIISSKGHAVLTVRLYLNPPVACGGSCFQRIDVIAMPDNLRHGLMWTPDVGGLWRLGPPDAKPHIARGHVTVYTGYRDSDVSDFKYRLPEINSGSEKSLQLASRWLADCLTNHGSNCRQNHSAFPTRLVDVGHEGSINPKLVTTEGQQGAYLALSYCWGQVPFFTLTAANMTRLHSTIPLEELPSTIRDAVILTRHLGVRYLWVDCLCIIQGTDEAAVMDWQRESRLMEKVFSGALLTISAAGAAGAHEGLFRDRPTPKIPYCRIPATQDDDQAVYLGPNIDDDSPRAEPLSQRGWAFQEAVLSARILSYGSSELSWKCQSCQCREGLIQPLKSDNDPMRVIDKYSQAAQLYASWKAIVEEYSMKKLTFMTDRLPAISGLAELVSNRLRDDYHFGVWEYQTRELLMWKHLGRIAGGKPEYKRQANHRAPSWSWASVDGSVKFLRVDDGSNKHNTRKKDNPIPFQVLFIKDGSIVLKGHLQRIGTLRYQTEGRYYGGYENYIPWMCYTEAVRTFIDDLDDVPEENTKLTMNSPKELVNVWFLFLGRSEGLILVPQKVLVGASKWQRWQAPTLEGLSVNYHKIRARKRVFRRIGAFVGYPSPVKYREKTVELI